MPRLTVRAGAVKVVRRMLRVAGLGESALDEKIAPIYTQYENPQTTILFNRTEVEIHLTARGRSEEEAEALLDRLSVQLEESSWRCCFLFCREKRWKRSWGSSFPWADTLWRWPKVAPAGLISERLTDVAGSSKYFVEGVVAYSNETKKRALGVKAALLSEHGAVSKEVAEAMAEGVRKRARHRLWIISYRNCRTGRRQRREARWSCLYRTCG